MYGRSIVALRLKVLRIEHGKVVTEKQAKSSYTSAYLCFSNLMLYAVSSSGFSCGPAIALLCTQRILAPLSHINPTLIKKKIKFSSYIRKFGMEQLKKSNIINGLLIYD